MKDQVIARQQVAAACYYWNEVLLKCSPSVRAFGCELSAHNPRLFACVAEGQRLFNAGIFPKSPGGFKRVAAFVVLARRVNFFEFHLQRSKKKVPIAEEEIECWRVRALSVMILPILAKTVATVRANANTPAQDIALTEWKGFPSRHFKAEFFHWLRGLIVLRGQGVNDSVLSSAILSCSLMLEACYYLGSTPRKDGELRGLDYDCLKAAPSHIEIDLNFEAIE